MVKLRPISFNATGVIPSFRVPKEGNIYHFLPETGEVALERGFKIPDSIKNYDITKVRIDGKVPVFKEIITFLDSSKRVVQRYFLTNGVNEKAKFYEYPDDKTKLITTKKFVLPPNLCEDISAGAKNLLGKWVEFTQEFQRVVKFPELQTKNKIPSKVYIKKTEFRENYKDVTCCEYPLNLGLESGSKKVVNAKLTVNNGDLDISDVKMSDNLNLSLSDKFLKYRLAGANKSEGLIALTKHFLREKGLDKLSIVIEPSSWHIDEEDLGSFSLKSRAIRYNDNLGRKPSVLSVKTAAHEVEHAWQYSQIGRLGKGVSSYETDALFTLGDLPSEDVSEGLKYVIARDAYPRNISPNELAKNPLYKNNYMEVKARQAGDAAEADYVRDKKNYEFFENFT